MRFIQAALHVLLPSFRNSEFPSYNATRNTMLYISMLLAEKPYKTTAKVMSTSTCTVILDVSGRVEASKSRNALPRKREEK